MQVSRIAVATPYLDEVNRREAEYMSARGFEICAMQGLQLEKDSDMVRVSPKFIHDFAASIDRPDAEAVFISCESYACQRDLANPLWRHRGRLRFGAGAGFASVCYAVYSARRYFARCR
mgnify:CR=1 FL=1